MTKLKRIGVMFSAKLFAVVAGSLGLIAGIFYSFGGAIYDLATTQSFNTGTALAFLALLGMPLIFAGAGFVIGAVGAPLYNLAAGWFGGIKLDIQ